MFLSSRSPKALISPRLSRSKPPKSLFSLPDEIICHMISDESIIKSEGIFRVPGNSDEIKSIMKKYKKNKPVDLTKVPPDSLASALKQWFREQEKPLMTFELYDSWISAIEIEDSCAKIEALKRVVNMIPEDNRKLLQSLCRLLRKIHLQSEINKMTATNLAIVFSPTLLWSEEEVDPFIMLQRQTIGNEVIENLIVSYKDFFLLKPSKPLSRDVSVAQDMFLDSLERGSVKVAISMLDSQKQRQQVISIQNLTPDNSIAQNKQMTLGKQDQEKFNQLAANRHRPKERRRTALSNSTRVSVPVVEMEKNRRRQLLKNKISLSNQNLYRDAILEARNTVKMKKKKERPVWVWPEQGGNKSPRELDDKQIGTREHVIGIDKNEKHKIESSEGSEDSESVEYNADKHDIDIVDNDKDKDNDKTKKEDSIIDIDEIQEMLLGIMTGNGAQVRAYIEAFEGSDIQAHLQKLTKLDQKLEEKKNSRDLSFTKLMFVDQDKKQTSSEDILSEEISIGVKIPNNEMESEEDIKQDV